ncbi:MAG: type I 3-dehydroquinate dehydratase [Dehalococcoidia bacterium]|nr:type I 3-dehydroquinate dehydratase [Dehalococcoidia bacterium]
MDKPRICAVITSGNTDVLKRAEPLSDLFELRMDLVGSGWHKLIPHMHKPWIATMRDVSHQGKFTGREEERVNELMRAVELGASIVDIELDSPALKKTVKRIKGRAKCLISYHNWDETPPLEHLSAIVRQQLAAGAAVCKVVTMARNMNDSLAVLELPGIFPGIDIISFAMGPAGALSRVLSPLAGGYLTYASMDDTGGSAPGQISVDLLRNIYRMIM